MPLARGDVAKGKPRWALFGGSGGMKAGLFAIDDLRLRELGGETGN